MRAIFISYRRNDSEGEAGRLFDDLVGHFGEDSVFMDVSAIEAGRDFRKAIDESVATCGVLLAIIGNNWVDAKNDAGLRRLDDPADFVRLETAAALRRDIPVIPVLIRGAKMPRPEQLPDDLKDLAYRNGVELTHARWGSDIRLLIKALDTVLGPLRRAGTTETPQSGGHAADGATLVKHPLEKSANGKPSSGLPAVRRRETKWLALGGGLMVVLALVGYGAYYFKVERERQAIEQQRRTAEDDAARRRAEAERAELEQKKADLEKAAAQLAADRAATDKAVADRAAADKAVPPTASASFDIKIVKASCTDLGNGRYRVETWGTASGDGESALFAGPMIHPSKGTVKDGKTACSSWSGGVRLSDGSLNKEACKRGENEAFKTDWKSSHVFEWRWHEPPDRAYAALQQGAGRAKAGDRATFKCAK